MNKIIVFIVLVLVVVGGAYWYYDRKERERIVSEKIEQMNLSPILEAAPGQTNGTSFVKFGGEVLAGQNSQLINFNQADFDVAVASDKLVVLYFYANWCPICRQEFPLLQSAFNELKSDAVVGFRINYNDSETDENEKNLARKYGITYQHTKVFVKNGTQILKTLEEWDKNKYLSEIAIYAK